MNVRASSGRDDKVTSVLHVSLFALCGILMRSIVAESLSLLPQTQITGRTWGRRGSIRVLLPFHTGEALAAAGEYLTRVGPELFSCQKK